MDDKNIELKEVLFEEDYHITRTEDTEQLYYDRAKQLIKRAKKELNVKRNDVLDPRQLVIWLENHKKNIKSSSWREYKSAVMFYLSTYVNTLAGKEAVEYLRDIGSVGTLKYSDKTSAQKLKRIPLEDWKQLESYLLKIHGKWHEPLLYWMRATMLTGLRPVEWRNAVILYVDDKIALRVNNAKNTNGRAHGQYRHILLSALKAEEIDDIRKHLENIRAYETEERFRFFYESCKFSLWRANRRLWKKRKRHITLYSCRHQFTANAKFNGYLPEEIAALMGHAVDKTNIVHYGRKVAGRSSSMVKPLTEEVNKVKKLANQFNWKKYIEESNKSKQNK